MNEVTEFSSTSADNFHFRMGISLICPIKHIKASNWHSSKCVDGSLEKFPNKCQMPIKETKVP
jgi:hypothetical protein